MAETIIWAPSTVAGTPISAGGTSYSGVPTLAEINAGTGANQIAAALNRRSNQYLSSPTALSYASPGARPSAAWLNSLYARAYQLCDIQNGTTTVFTGAVAAGQVMRANALTDLRTLVSSLNTIKVPLQTSLLWEWLQVDNVWGDGGAGGVTNSHLTVVGSMIITQLGKLTRGRGVPYGGNHRRLGLNFNLPAYVSSAFSGTLHMLCTFGSAGTDFETCQPAVYASNSDDSGGGSGWWANLNNGPFNGTAYSTADQVFALPGSVLAARTGAMLSVVFGQGYELAGAGGIGAANNSPSNFATQSLLSSATPPVWLELTF